MRLVRECLLGLRLRRSSLCIDPVLPPALDGLVARIELEGRAVAVRYRVGPLGHGPRTLTCNGRPLAFDREPHPYRTGGAVIPMDVLRERLRDGEQRTSRSRSAEMTQDRDLLDDFRDISGWSAVASGQAQLTLGSDAGPAGEAALRLDYDFKGGGGFVVARKNLARPMPAAWALSLRVRGAAPANKLEIKFADPSGRNVWWWHRDAFDFPADWQRCASAAARWRSPGGRRAAERCTSSARSKSRSLPGRAVAGRCRCCDLRFEDLSLAGPPRVAASSTAQGHEPEHALHASPATSWRSADAVSPAWLALDFGREHEYGGLVIDWAAAGAARAFEVQCSDDGASWTALATATQAEGERSYVYLPGGGCSRHLRLFLHAPPAGGGPHEIRLLDVRPFDFSRSLADFFHAVAACEPRGHHPRWLHREQSYWTPVGIAGGTTAAILNEEGLFEPDRGSFSLEPFLHVDGELITWADAEVSVSLAQGVLPIPSSTWRCGDLTLTITAFAAIESGRAQARTAVPGRERRFGLACRAPLRGVAPLPGVPTVAGVPGHRRHCADPHARVARRCRAGERRHPGRAANGAERIRRRRVRAGRGAAPSGARRAPAAPGDRRCLWPRVRRAVLGPRNPAGCGA